MAAGALLWLLEPRVPGGGGQRSADRKERACSQKGHLVLHSSVPWEALAELFRSGEQDNLTSLEGHLGYNQESAVGSMRRRG